MVTILTASAAPLNLKGINGPIYQEGTYLIDSSSMPCLFYDDAGSTTKFEILSITSSKTILSNKFIKYSDDFETDKWTIDLHSSSNVARSVNGVVSGESVIHPTIMDEQASVKYNIDFISAIEKATISVTGTRRDTEHTLEVWVGNNDTAYSKVIEFENTARTTAQTDITSHLQDNQTWIEFRFLKSSFGDNSPRILDFSIEAIYEGGVASPAVNASVGNTSYTDDFDTDKWTADKQSEYGVSRSVNGVVANETVLYPTIADNKTYVRYSFNLSDKDSALLTITGTRRDADHNLTIWASQDNISYTKIMEFENTARTTKQVDISNFIGNNLTWLEFRFFKNSSGDNTPRILDFSINTTSHQWQPLNVITGGNIEIPTRTIDCDHFYYFAPHYSSPLGPNKARIAYLGNKYPAIDINSQQAVLGKFIKNDADIKLTYGTPLSLGNGFVLEIEDASTDNVVIALKKDGIVLDRGTFEEGKTYSYRTEIEGVKDIELFKADIVSVLRSDFYTMVELENVYLLDTVATIVKDGETFDDFEVDLVDFDKDGDVDITIKLKDDRTFTLNKNNTINLFGDLSIKVADSEELRFTVIKNHKRSGEYQQTGPYGNYGQTYNINSLDAPGLFTYDMDKNDTFESLSISSSSQKINNIVYSSLNKNGKVAYLGKTYNVVRSGEKLLLNEILEENDEKLILRYGSPIRIGTYVLELQDVGEETALLQLKKDGSVLEEDIVEKGDSFVYKKQVENMDVEILNITVSNIFKSEFSTFVEIENNKMLEETVLILNNGDEFRNNYKIRIDDINGDNVPDVEVKLKSGESFNVNEDSTTEILGGYLYLKAYEKTFLPVRSVKIDTDPADVPPPSIEMASDSPQQSTTDDKETTIDSSIHNTESDQSLVSKKSHQADSNQNPKKESLLEYVLLSTLILFMVTYGWFRFRV
jgi:hypothetical protein